MAAGREVEQQALDVIAGRSPDAAEAAPSRFQFGGMEIAGAILWLLVLVGGIAFGTAYLMR